MNDETRRTLLKALAAGTAVTAGVGAATAQEDDGQSRVFGAGVLSGENQVSEAVDSTGVGAASFQLGTDGSELRYGLVVSAIEDVTQAHIHVGGADENGPVVAFLYGAEDDEGNFTGPRQTGVTESGLLAEGTITDDDLVGPLEGASLDELVARLREGDAYVNVHTVQNPAGEIRAQIEPTGDEVEIELESEVQIEAASDGLDVTERSVLEFGDTVVATGQLAPGQGEDGDETGTPTETPTGDGQ